MPRQGDVSVHVDEFCREHGDGFYMYAQDHPGDAEFLVLRNPDPQPRYVRYPTTASNVHWTWEDLLLNDFEEDRL